MKDRFVARQTFTLVIKGLHEAAKQMEREERLATNSLGHQLIAFSEK